jgi:hypothetical protein
VVIASEAYAPFYAAMRRRHGYCGPYRLGIAIGEAGADLPNPYTKARSRKNFDDGIVVGQRRRAREAAESDIRIAIWNAARESGMAQDPALALIERVMAQPAMRRAINAGFAL